MLYSAVEQAPATDLVEPEVTARYFAQFDEQFFHFCEKELLKINTFYNGNNFGLLIEIAICFSRLQFIHYFIEYYL